VKFLFRPIAGDFYIAITPKRTLRVILLISLPLS